MCVACDLGHPEACSNQAPEQMRCERCKRFIGEDCLEGWSGGLYGDYDGRYYCAAGKGCNSDEAIARAEAIALHWNQKPEEGA